MAGITQIVWQGEYLVHPANCAARNDAVLLAMRVSPDRLRAFASIQPDDPHAVMHIARYLAAGMSGVGELNPVAQGFSLRSAAFLRCAEYCAHRAVPMLFHVNEPVGPAYPGKVDQPLWAYYELAARFPELPIILAHWGGGLWFYEQIPSVRQVLQNVYYDTAASWLTYPNTALMMQMAMSVVPHKVLFGSDFPLKKPKTALPNLADWFTEVRDGIPHPWQSSVLGGAAHTLLTRVDSPQLQPQSSSTLPIDLRTPVVLLVEQHPASVPVLARWHIDVTAHTPWWQSIAHAAVSAGHHPHLHAQLLYEINEVL